MKKNKYILILAACIALTFSSCKDDNLLFDDSSSARTNKALNELHEVLMSAGSTGWKVQYYTDTAYYGAYNIVMSFEYDKVTMQGDELFPVGKHQSLYDISTPQGVALVFKTYNDVITLLADADKTAVTNQGENLGGDNEFIWLKNSENKDTVYFKTKKSQQHVKFIRFSEADGTWDSYLERINTMSRLFSEGDMNKYFKEIQMDNGVSLLLTGYDAIKRTMNPAYINSRDSLIVQTNGIAFTETGFEFFEPLYIDGKYVQHFTYRNGQFEIDDEGVSGYIKPVSQPQFEFPGNIVSERLFVNRKHYYFTGNNIATLRIQQEILDSIIAHVPDFQRYRGVRFYPEGTSGSIYRIQFEYSITSDDYLHILAVLISVKPDIVRDDKITLSPYALPIDVYGADTEELKASVIENFKLFAESIVGSTSAGKTYIIIPSPDYKEFTFGATDSTTGFVLDYSGAVE